MEGLIFNIQRFSIHDGPGIRTTVFLKGCNLQCFWCHNPESIMPKMQIQFSPDKCIKCGKCFSICPNHAHQFTDVRRVFKRELCTGCGKCAEICYAEALKMCGKYMDVDEIIQEVEKDSQYYKSSGGGVTFSGGEPLLQKEFLSELLAVLKNKGYHTAIDTAGNVPWETFEQVLPNTDLFLFDIKLFDEEKHRNVTGVGNRRIHDNIKRLGDGRVDVWVRIPIIPGVNDNIDEMNGIASLLEGLEGIKLIELLPFHKLGGSKYDSLGIEYQAKELTPPSNELMNKLVDIFKDRSLNAKRR